jgi:hypothetical protein
MSGHDPFRGATDSLTGLPASDAPPPALTGSGSPAPHVPDGKVADVVAWIDNGRSAQQRHERAAAALESDTRKGVVKHAQAVLAG